MQKPVRPVNKAIAAKTYTMICAIPLRKAKAVIAKITPNTNLMILSVGLSF